MWSELLERVKARALAAQEHQDIPFEQVVEIVRPARSLAHEPVFQAMFAWQNNAAGGTGAAGPERGSPSRRPTGGEVRSDAGLARGGGRIVGGLEYATALFEPGDGGASCRVSSRLLEAMAAGDAAGRVDRLPLLGEAERHQLVVEWNDDGGGVSRRQVRA